MKILKKVLIVLFISVVSLWGCSSAEDEKIEYYARAAVLDEKLGIETAYITDEEQFNERVVEINALIDNLSKIELDDENDQKYNRKAVKSAQDCLKKIRELREVTIKSEKREKKDDFSLMNKYDKALDNFETAHLDYSIYYSGLAIMLPDDERTTQLEEYNNSFSATSSETEGLFYYLDDIIYRGAVPTNSEVKEINKKLAAAKSTLAKLKNDTIYAVDVEDQDLKEYKEDNLQKVISISEKMVKSLKKGDTYQVNKLLKEGNIYLERSERDIHYNILVKPYLDEKNQN